MQASLVITVTGKLGLVVPSWGTPLPGAFAQHSPSKAWLSLLPDYAPLRKGSGPNFPAPHLTNTQCEAPRCPLHKAPRPLAQEVVGWAWHAWEYRNTARIALRHILKHMCSPSELLGASHPHPYAASPTTKATGNRSPQQHSRHNAKPKCRLRCQVVLSI